MIELIPKELAFLPLAKVLSLFPGFPQGPGAAGALRVRLLFWRPSEATKPEGPELAEGPAAWSGRCLLRRGISRNSCPGPVLAVFLLNRYFFLMRQPARIGPGARMEL